MSLRLGQYELLEKFAEGGMAEVWFGRVLGAEGFSREVAVKRLLPKSVHDPELIAMFLDEARLGARLHHPNIVGVLDLGELDGSWFMVMELVDGPHLGRLFAHSLRIGKPLPHFLCAAIVAAAAEGLHHAHERVDPLTGRSLEIVHRDVSPQNVLISQYGDVKVTDFGVARARTHRSQTRSGLVKGKLGYLAPEQCRGQPLDRRADVFSLGIVLYELLTRRRLYRGDGEFEVMRRICEEEPLPPGVLEASCDTTLGEIALRALRKAPEGRFQTAAELGDALLAWLHAGNHGDWRAELAWWVRSHTSAIWPPLEQRVLRWRERDGEVIVSRDEIREQIAMPVLRSLLPEPQGVFVGRRVELAALEAYEADGGRLLVVSGPTGVGKSRLALRYAELAASRGAPVVWADLTGIDSGDGVVIAVARVLGIDGVSDVGDVDLRIGHALRHDETLLIVDNADGVADSLGRLLSGWLARAPNATCLVTTRQRLRWHGERSLELGPLSLPEGDDLSRSEAAMLLLARARAVRPNFRVGEGGAGTLARIVRLLDGLPLAIELAAARLDVFEPDALLQRLEAGSADLRGPGRYGDTSLREAFASSVTDLDEPLRALLGRATVFAAPFELAAAEAVLADDEADRALVLGRLDALRDRSMLRLLRDEGVGRYALLRSMRPVAQAAISAATYARTVERHQAWLASTARDLRGRLDRHGAAEALRRLQRLRDELGAAVAASMADSSEAKKLDDDHGAQLLALAELRLRRGPHEGLVELLSAALKRAPSAETTAQLRLVLGRQLIAEGRFGEARVAVEAAVTRVGPEALALLGQAALRQGRAEEARAFCARGLQLCRDGIAVHTTGSLLLVEAEALCSLGHSALAGSAAVPDAAAVTAERAADALRAIGDAHLEATALLLIGQRALDTIAATLAWPTEGPPAKPSASPQLERAATCACDALDLAERAGETRTALAARLLLTVVALSRGDAEEAALSLQNAQPALDRVGDAGMRADAAWLQLVVATARGRLSTSLAADAVERAQVAADRGRMLRAHCWQAAVLRRAGNLDAAEVAIEHAEGWAIGSAVAADLIVARWLVHGDSVVATPPRGASAALMAFWLGQLVNRATTSD